MSVSLFPNANAQALEDLFTELDKATMPPQNPALEAQMELILLAHGCAAVESLVRSPSIRAYLDSQDPTMVAEIEALLNSCR